MDSPSNFFSLMPMGQHFSLNPGETTTGSIFIINPQSSTEDFTYKIRIVPYGVKGEDYDLDIVTDSDMTQIKDWIIIEEPEGTVTPGETREVKFHITVPETAPGGGQYSALVVGSNKESAVEEGTVVINSSYEMASIIYAEIAGETVHSGSIVSHDIPSFSTTPEVSLNATFENKGNVHETAKISLVVSDFFSGEDYFSTEEEGKDIAEVVMPFTTRHLIRDISNLPSLGIVTIKESIEYMGDTSDQESHLIICPLWFLILVCLTVSALLFAILVRLFHFHKESKNSPASNGEEFED